MTITTRPPSSILELGWSTIDNCQPIKRTTNTFPDDLFPTLCRHVHPKDDATSLLALQRVSKAAWKAATRRLYAHITLDSTDRIRDFFAAMSGTRRKSNRVKYAIRIIRSISFTVWDATCIVEAMDQGFIGLPNDSTYLFSERIQLGLPAEMISKVLSYSRYGPEGEEYEFAAGLAVYGMGKGMSKGTVWVQHGPFDMALCGMGPGGLENLALRILMLRLAPISQLCLTVPPLSTLPPRWHYEHPAEYAERCLTPLSEATADIDIPIINVHNARFDDPLGFAFSGRLNRVRMVPGGSSYHSLTPVMLESGLLIASSGSRFELPVKYEVVVSGNIPEGANERKWGKDLATSYKAWLVQHRFVRNREHMERLKKMEEAVGADTAVFVKREDVPACGVCGGHCESPINDCHEDFCELNRKNMTTTMSNTQEHDTNDARYEVMTPD